VDLGVVADPLQQPVDDPRRAPAAPGDRAGAPSSIATLEDPRRALDDRGESSSS
jgi:hypothetical protein